MADVLTVPLTLSIPAGTTLSAPVQVQVKAPRDAHFSYVVLQFPPGSQGTVSVYVHLDGQRVWPPSLQGADAGISLDGVTERFPLSVPVRGGQTVGLAGTNSGANVHVVKAVLGEG